MESWVSNASTRLWRSRISFCALAGSPHSVGSSTLALNSSSRCLAVSQPIRWRNSSSEVSISETRVWISARIFVSLVCSDAGDTAARRAGQGVANGGARPSCRVPRALIQTARTHRAKAGFAADRGFLSGRGCHLFDLLTFAPLEQVQIGAHGKPACHAKAEHRLFAVAEIFGHNVITLCIIRQPRAGKAVDLQEMPARRHRKWTTTVFLDCLLHKFLEHRATHRRPISAAAQAARLVISDIHPA